MTQFPKHFSLFELTVSEEARARGLDNSPGPAHRGHLLALALAMETVRRILGDKPVRINSAYRSPAVNAAVGGVANSDHALGFAADFTCAGFGTPFDICAAIEASDLAFDQLIHERRAWVHLSIHPRLRRQTLTLAPGARAYVTGLRR